MRLDLDPLRPDLEKLYSSSPRGRKPFDPILMLRALLLLTALGQKKITQFASDLSRKPRLAQIAGFDPQNTPAVGTFYLFIDRLEDGPFAAKCPHLNRPSQLRKKPLLRNLSQEKAEKEKLRAEILAHSDSITQKLKDDLLSLKDQPRPQDFLARLEDLLFKAALVPSARRQMLGDLNNLVVCGDGPALVSGASPFGKPSCQCRQDGIFRCTHSRSYPDHTANWGWDSYREVYYFGHTFYQHIVNFGGHDLPVHLNISQASESDFTLYHRLYFNCPVKRPTHLDGKTVWQSHVDQCPHKVLRQPDSKMGPVVFVRLDSDPRLYPRIARDSSKFKDLMKLRSGCERSNSVKKVAHKLERRPCRSATHYLFRLYLISVIEHAKAWIAEDRKALGDDFAKLIDLATPILLNPGYSVYLTEYPRVCLAGAQKSTFSCPVFCTLGILLWWQSKLRPQCSPLLAMTEALRWRFGQLSAMTR